MANSIPLIIIWATNLYYEGNFILHEEEWRSSLPCYFAFVFSLKFSLLSPILLSCLSLSRLMLVIHPVDTQFKKTVFVFKCMTIVFAFASVVAISITIITWTLVAKVPTILCLPFIDPTDSVAMTKVLTCLVTATQLSAAIFITTTYIILIKSLKTSPKNIQQSASKKQSFFTLITQITTVIGSNILCWIPSCIVYLVTVLWINIPLIC